MAAELSINGLRAELIALGANVGPITEGTRSVYEKKWAKLKAEQGRKGGKIRNEQTVVDTAPKQLKHRKPTPNRKGRVTTRNSVISETELSDSEQQAPIRRSPKKTSVVPGRLNLSSTYVLPSVESQPITRHNVSAVPSSNYSQSTRQSDPFGFSSGDDSDGHEESTRFFTSRSVNTSFKRGSAVKNTGIFTKQTYDSPKKLSPLQSVVSSLKKLREDGADMLRNHSPFGRSRFEYSRTPGEYYRLRSGREHYQMSKRDGDWHFRSMNVESHGWISRMLLIILGVFLLGLLLTYLGYANEDKVKIGFRAAKGAAKDTVAFFYTYAILPVLAVGLVGGVGIGIYFLQRYQQIRKKNKEQELFEMVDEIILSLRSASRTAKNEDDACLAIPHVRDMLIPAHLRQSKEKLWNSAVQHISKNESRISTETKFMNGQECLVWRWISSDDNEPSWQGNALSEAQSDLNSPNRPYSECLKLRGMFDPEETQKSGDWTDFIQDALLEKLGRNIEVLHMAVDRASKEGVVLLKLASKVDAEKAFKILQGSWFNGHLVSVKYLRTERYLERFPEALRAKIALTIKKPRHTTTTTSYYRY